jgi:hypothetical protein
MRKYTNFADNVIRTASEMSTKEAGEYLQRKMTELDNAYSINTELGNDTTEINRSIEDLFDWFIDEPAGKYLHPMEK